MLAESANPANFPVRAGSLTNDPSGRPEETRGDKVVSKESIAKAISTRVRETCPVGLVETGSQSERRGKRAGCRKTNIRKHRKGCRGGHSWQSRGESSGEPLFDGRSLADMGKQLETCTPVLDGVKEGGMRGPIHGFNSGESLHGSVHAADKARYKPSGESRAEAMQEVGDGHSTVYRVDNTTAWEGRAISLKTSKLTEGPA